MLRGRKTQAVVLALGLLVLLTVGAIPGIGPVVMVLATLVAFGAAIRTRFGNRLARHARAHPLGSGGLTQAGCCFAPRPSRGGGALC